MLKSNVIVVTNQKGGVGKTTTAVNLATGLSIVNEKVLIIDLDPQGNSSTGVGIEYSQRKPTIYDVLIKGCNIVDSILHTKMKALDVITSDVNLAAAEIELNYFSNREYVVKHALISLISQYSYIIIDCPPSLGLLTINALVAAHEIIIPIQCEFYALEGLSYLLKTINIISTKFNNSLKILGILLTMYDRRNALTVQVEQDVRKCLGNLVFKTVIYKNVKLAEAPSYGKPGIIYDSRSAGAIAYINLVKEIQFVRNENLNKDGS